MTDWILLRGLSREQRHWHQLPDRVAAHVGDEVALVDLPGFGTEHQRPSPRDVRAITDDVRARVDLSGPVGLLAISLGGMIALDWSHRYPDEVSRVVTLNTSARISPPWQRFRPAGARMAVARRHGDLGAERAILRVTSNRPPADLEQVAVEHAAWLAERRPRTAAVAAQLYAASRFAPPAAIDPPLLVLTSTADRLVSWRCSAELAARYHAPLHLHGWAGHDLSLDDPDWVVDRIAAWTASGV